MALPPPWVLGAPTQFQDWRPGQEIALSMALTTPQRFIALTLPTGTGKSLVGMMGASMSTSRMVYLTSTRGLQDQIIREFQAMGLVDVRGMSNYPCRELRERGWSGACDDGPCLDGLKCNYRPVCDYYVAVEVATGTQVVVTNYAFWITRALKDPAGFALGPRDMLILDEAHNAADEVAGALRISIDEAEYQLPRGELPLAEWREWAKDVVKALGQRMEVMPPGNARRKLRMLRERVERLANAQGKWIVERTDRGMAWEPLWPGPYCEALLFRNIPRVWLMSATLRPKTLSYLGLEPADYLLLERPSPFPLESRLVTHVPTARITAKAKPADMDMWVTRIDQIISRRLDRKGIIHTVSYDRARLLTSRSEFRSLMIDHDRRNARDRVQQFKQASAPSILVSPSVTTGYDFPYEEAEYQIIAKVPWPDTRSPLMTAREEEDPDYAPFLAMSEIIQMAGRGVRGDGDFCETLCVDDTVKWFLPKYQQFAPVWFMEAYRRSKIVPDPPLKMQRGT